MMNEHRFEAIVGILVIICAGTFLYFLLQDSRTNSVQNGYEIIGEFTSAQGVTVGTEVRLAGINVGSVTDMVINPETYMADVTLRIDEAIEIRTDSTLAVTSEGLLGGYFIDLQQGFDPESYGPGERVTDTQPYVDFMQLLANFSNSISSIAE